MPHSAEHSSRYRASSTVMHRRSLSNVDTWVLPKGGQEVQTMSYFPLNENTRNVLKDKEHLEPSIFRWGLTSYDEEAIAPYPLLCHNCPQGGKRTRASKVCSICRSLIHFPIPFRVLQFSRVTFDVGDRKWVLFCFQRINLVWVSMRLSSFYEKLVVHKLFVYLVVGLNHKTSSIFIIFKQFSLFERVLRVARIM